MNIDNAFPSKYIKASDLENRDAPVTMGQVVMEEVGGDQLPVLYFQGKQKGLVLNKTNSSTISKLYGGETSGWAGNPITLFPTQTDYAGKQVECIRIRLAAPQSPSPQAPPANYNGAPMPSDDEIPY